jgi:PTS system mannose-specific IIA component
MSIALFFITHEGIASNLLTIAERILDSSDDNIRYLEVPMDAPIHDMVEDCKQKLLQLSTAQGLLFITDAYGSTPGNISQQLASELDKPLISGVNLPMVIRLLNYREEDMATLVDKALDAARTCIRQYN